MRYAQIQHKRTAAHGWLLAITATLLVTGCASFAPRPVSEVPFLERAQQQSADGLTVTVAVPTRDEATELYGVDLADKDVQPIWIEVRNDQSVPNWLLTSGIDPAYFAASEAAYAFRYDVAASARPRLEAHFAQLQFPNPIQPRSTASGFLLVNRDEGYKALDIDLLSRRSAASFTFITTDPSFRGAGNVAGLASLYTEDDLVHVDDENELRRLLESLPCCTSNKSDRKEGDPLNLVMVGAQQDIFPAFVRRGWHPTEETWSGAIWKTIKAFMSGERYRYAPISPLYVFGRQQDLAIQKARSTIHERNHLRLWLTPVRYHNRPVWIGQISRDIGVKFTPKSPTISTHVIDPDVDEARRYLQEDLAYSQAIAATGLVKGVGKTSRDKPRVNLVGDPWYSDGLRAVMMFEPRPRGLGGIDFIAWEAPPGTERIYYGD